MLYRLLFSRLGCLGALIIQVEHYSLLHTLLYSIPIRTWTSMEFGRKLPEDYQYTMHLDLGK